MTISGIYAINVAVDGRIVILNVKLITKVETKILKMYNALAKPQF